MVEQLRNPSAKVLVAMGFATLNPSYRSFSWNRCSSLAVQTIDSMKSVGSEVCEELPLYNNVFYS